jgi:hypothetical protein
MRLIAAAVMLSAATLVSAEEVAETASPPLSAAEFDARTVGRTMFYSSKGRPYGAEQYLPGRRVVWAFLGDDCRTGRWYEEAGYICFVYEDANDPQCWTFHEEGGELIARFRGDPASAPLIAVQQSPEPLACLGPDVGV